MPPLLLHSLSRISLLEFLMCVFQCQDTWPGLQRLRFLSCLLRSYYSSLVVKLATLFSNHNVFKIRWFLNHKAIFSFFFPTAWSGSQICWLAKLCYPHRHQAAHSSRTKRPWSELAYQTDQDSGQLGRWEKCSSCKENVTTAPARQLWIWNAQSFPDFNISGKLDSLIETKICYIVLYLCPNFETLWTETWNKGTCLDEMLYGPQMALRKTAEFVRRTKLNVKIMMRNHRRRRRRSVVWKFKLIIMCYCLSIFFRFSSSLRFLGFESYLFWQIWLLLITSLV